MRLRTNWLTLALLVLVIASCAEGSDPDPTFNRPISVNDDATFTPTDPEGFCGNDAAEFDEACDGPDLDGSSCESEGFVGGVLACDARCELDLSGCSSCGNGLIDAGEACDGEAILEASCAMFGFEGGTLRCSDDCVEVELDDCYGGPAPDPDPDPEPGMDPEPGQDPEPIPYAPCAGDMHCAAVDHCVELAATCSPSCATNADCPAPGSGSATAVCHAASSSCYLVCSLQAAGPCPVGLTCTDDGSGSTTGLCTAS